jgi:gamma-glutamyltranspeptidase/glutathione hydrolase
MRPSSPHPQLKSEHGCVVSYCPVASSVGSRVLRQGGNAVDAAVATAFALAVTYPQAGNLGGGGFMVVRSAGGEVVALDYRETAPARLTPDHLRDPEQSVLGALAVGTPGTVAGMAAALERFGTWSWARVLTPAMKLAEEGLWLTTRQSGYFELHMPWLTRFESTRRYFTNDGALLLPGTLFRQPDLARTLQTLAEDGPGSFYQGQGKIAALLLDEMARGGGVLDAEDLAGYTARWGAPESCRFAGGEVFSPPLPSAGGLVLQTALRLLEVEGISARDSHSPPWYQLMVECCRTAFALRYRFAGDPEHLTAEEQAQLSELQSPEALHRLHQQIRRRPAEIDDPGAQRSTTHFCVVDPLGNAVSNTFSLNTMFGAKLAVAGGGFLLNNCIDDFSIAPERENWYAHGYHPKNALRPRSRPLSSMAPSLVERDGKVVQIIGGSGGPRIPTLMAQVLTRTLVVGDSIAAAVRTRRVHHQYSPDALVAELGVPEPILQALAAQGHIIDRTPQLGACAAITVDPESGRIAATLDPRFSLEDP